MRRCTHNEPDIVIDNVGYTLERLAEIKLLRHMVNYHGIYHPRPDRTLARLKRERYEELKRRRAERRKLEL